MRMTSWLSSYRRSRHVGSRFLKRRKPSKPAALFGLEMLETRTLLSGTPLELSGVLSDDTYIKGSTNDSEDNFSTETTILIDGAPDIAALFRIDTSDIAAGSQVQSASLTFHVTDPSVGTWEIYEVLRSWNPTEVAFDWPSLGQSWEIDGAQGVTDHGTAVLGTLTATATGTVTVNLNAAGVAVVQKWVDDPSSNHGLIIQDYLGSADGLSFDSREAAVAANRPTFSISYTGTGGTNGNLAPAVDAGLDQSVIFGQTVSLNGTVSDDGLPTKPGSVTTNWAVVSGPGNVTIGNAGGVDTTATFSAAGTYVLRLRADDGELATMDIVVIDVIDPSGNVAPVVDAGPDQAVFLTSTLHLNGNVTDDGVAAVNPITTHWTQVSGPGTATFSNADTRVTTATFNAAGTYVLQLSASDGIATTTDRVTITVYELGGNTAPAVSAGDDLTILLNQIANLNGVVVDNSTPDPNALPVTAGWTLLSGPGSVTFGSASSAKTTATFSAAGIYVLQLQSNDGTFTSTDTVTVTVNALPVNQPPVVDAGPDRTIAQSNTLHLNATVTDDGISGPLATTWSVVSGPGTVTFTTASLIDAAATFSAAGTYVLRLTANDGQYVRTDDVSVTVLPNSSGSSSTVSFQNGVNGYTGNDDTYIRAASEEQNNGTSSIVRVDGLPDEAGLIRWDISSIAPGNQVSAATITINVTDTSPHTYELYAMKRSWSENQATWLQAADGQQWGVLGAAGTSDRDTVVLGTLTSTTTGLKTFQLNAAALAVIQGWINNPSTNFGFVIQDYDNATSDSLGFTSSEGTTISQRPKLSLTVGQPATPAGQIDLLPLANQTMPHSQDVISVSLPTSGATGTPIYSFEFTSIDPNHPLAAGDVVGSINGTTLTINPSAAYTGQFQVKVHVRDNVSDDVGTFLVTVGNVAPVLGPISGQTIYRDAASANVILPVSDGDNDPLTYTVVVDPGSDLYQLDQNLGLSADQNLVDNNYFQNARGYGEKYLQGSDGWYLLFKNGDLYRWGGSVPTSTFVASLGTSAYVNPANLWNPKAPPSINAAVIGNTLTVTPPSDYFGVFQVTVTVSDGLANSTQSFVINKKPLTATQEAALSTFQLQFPELVARTEDDLGTLSYLMNYSGYLTSASTGDPIQITFDFLQAHKDLFGLVPTDTQEFLVSSSHASAQSGLTYVYLQQMYSGLQVFGSVVNSGVAGTGEILVFGNSFAPNVAGSLNTLTPTLTARQAVESAAGQLGVAITNPLQVSSATGGPTQSVVFTDGGISRDPITVELSILPIERGESRLVWNMVINMRNSADWLNVLVDAQTGTILYVANWTDSASYRVFPLPLESPDDGPGLPGSHSIVTNPADPTASPFGWHDTNGSSGDEFTDTRGNNVFAQEDRDGDDTGGARPSGGTNNNYNYSFNPSLSPLQNQNEAIVNLFYWNNIVHDVMAHYGFDEASGNFQFTNYSGDGLGNDPVQADAQDAADFGVSDNANFATPPDGISPRMQMYEFDLTSPFRDSDNAAEIIVHEYGHGVSNRLVGGPADAGALQGIQSSGMGEGWSDFFSLVFTAKPTDLVNDSYPVGNYVLGNPSTGLGIRRFPYSFNMSINPLTYNDIDPLQIDVTNIPNPNGAPADEEHNVGEVWASVLWDMYWLLVQQDGFDADLYNGTGGNNTALRLVVEGLKLTPASPTFLDARDAILAADAALFDSANTNLIWQAFARRGMGLSAADGGDHNSTAVTEAFDVPPQIGVGPNVTLSLTGSPFAENGGVATVTATTAQIVDYDIRVNLQFSGTATNQIDYTPSETFIVIPAGQTSGSITLTGIDDSILEQPDETVIVDITTVLGGMEAGGQQQVTAVIADDDSLPKVLLEVLGSPFSENGGTATIRATLNHVWTDAVVVNLDFSGTAFQGLDYTASGTSITIAAGNLSGVITLTSVNDGIFEATESVVASISSIQNGVPAFGNLEVTAYITDDDGVIVAPNPKISMSISPVIFSENGGSATVTLTRDTRQKTSIVEFGYSGTAIRGTDYSAPAYVTIPYGELSTTFTITGINDLFIEPNESIIVDMITLFNGTEAGGFQQVSATITSDDILPPVQLDVSNTNINENGGSATITATLLGAPAPLGGARIFLGFGGSATYAETSPGSGIVDFGNSDYTYYSLPETPGAPVIQPFGSVSIFIPEGKTTGTLRLEAINDPKVENLETIVVSITSATGAVEFGNQQVTVTVLDDEPIATVTANWDDQGPSPTEGGQTENVNPNNPVVGAIQTVAAHPTNPDILWIGAVNGGIWRTENATAANPTWTPLTDNLPSLSIGALELDPSDPDRLIAGIGLTSSFARLGGRLTGLLLSIDGGDNWTQITDPLLVGKNFTGVAARGDVLLAASTSGLFRSIDGGTTWTQISGTNGLSNGSIFDMVGDPTDPARFYVSVRGVGIFRSNNSGASWTNVSQNDASVGGLNDVMTDVGNQNAEMAVSPTTGRLYVIVVNDGQAEYIGYTDNTGTSWTAMDLPLTPETGSGDVGLHPKEEGEQEGGGQGALHLSIAADPINANIVYVGGDRQPGGFPNYIGANNFSGRLFRGDTTVAPTGGSPSPQWEHLTHSNNIAQIPEGGTAGNSSPHADSREMTFDAGGRLIETDDGGIYVRTSPQDNTGDWFSLIGNLAVTEFHDIAYDTNSNIILGGAQDTGTPQQSASGSPVWDEVSQGDGGDVAVDNITLAGSNQSIRYSSFQNLGGFRRQTYDAANNLINTVNPALTVATGGDPLIPQFVTPIELNAIDPKRLLIGGANSLYESLDQGDNITDLNTPGVNGNGVNGNAMAYGGTRGGVDNPDVLYFGSGSTVQVRTTAGGAITAAAGYAGGFVRDVVLNTADWMKAFVIDSDQVFYTANAGTTFSDISGILSTVATDFRTLTYVVGGAADVLVLGTQSGVFASLVTSLGTWFKVGDTLPNVPVWDLDYDATDDVLVAGTFGRGAWLLNNASTVLNGPSSSDTPQVSLSFNYNPVQENGGQATITAILTKAQAVDVDVNLAFSGQATFGIDYELSGDALIGPTTIRIKAGDTFASIFLTAKQDNVKDVPNGNETVIVDITNVTGGVTEAGNNNGHVEGLILDADIPGSISGIKYYDQNANGIRDTIGNGAEIELAPMGPVVLTRNDDGSTTEILLGFTLNFFGTNYNSFFINNNGNVTFGGALGDFVPDGFPLNTGLPMIAPFWADVDTRSSGSGEVHFTSGVATNGHRFVQVDWPSVGYFSGHTDLLNTFTLYIEDDPNGDIVVFDYGDMEWTTGDIDGDNGFGGEGAQIGFDAGDGIHFLSYGRPNDAASVAQFSNRQLVFRLNDQGEVIGEPGLAGVTIYIDANNSGTLDLGELSTVTLVDDPSTTNIDETGFWSFTGLTPGETYIVREVVPFDYYQTAPTNPGYYTVELGSGDNVEGLEFGNARVIHPTVDLDVSKNVIPENGGFATVTATLSVATTVDVTVNLDVVTGSTATFGSDFTISTVAIIIPAGSLTGTATIIGQNDTDPEPIEKIRIDFTPQYPGEKIAGFLPLTVYVVDDDTPGPPNVIVEDAASVEEGNGDGTFTTGFGVQPEFYNTSTNTVSGRPNWVTTGDMNGDGYVDVIQVNTIGNSISVMLNRGDGTFSPGTSWSTGSNPTSAVVSDLDGDGDLDVAVTRDAAISVLINNGDATFVLGSGAPAGTLPSGITSGDFDEDGDVDLAVANPDGHVTIRWNNGNAAFGFIPATTIAVGSGPMEVKAGDIDGDGDLDLVVADNGLQSTTVSILQNDGTGTFTVSSAPAGLRPRSLVLGDFNGDNKVDVAVTNLAFNPNGPGNVNTVSVLLGNGNGTFQAPLTFAAGPSVLSLTAADLDVDGDLDLIVSNDDVDDHVLSVLFNDGSGSFGAPEFLSIGNFHIPYAVAAADVDLDGDPDIISAVRYGSGGVDSMAVFRSDADPHVLLFNVFLTKFSTSTVTVDYSTIAGTAIPGVDFLPLSGTLIFAPGEIVHTVAVPIIGELFSEDDETLSLVLSNVTGGAVIGDGSGAGTIVNDDTPFPPLVSLSVGGNSIGENGGATTITAFLTSPVDHDVVVQLGFTGSAANNTDYRVTSSNAPISIDGNFADWHANPNIEFFNDPLGDTHDTDTTGAGNTPLPVDHPDVDVLQYAVTHDDHNFYFYFKADGEIGRTQIEDLANGLAAGRYYIIVTMDVDNNDATGYELHEGGYYPTTGGYDMNAEIEYFNGAFNTGNYLNHGATDDASRNLAFEQQSNDQFDSTVPYNSWATQGPFDPGFVNILPGTYDNYTQWVYQENNPAVSTDDKVVFVKDKGPVVLGNITGAASADGHEYEYVVPFKGFLINQFGDPVIAPGRIVDLSFSLEASGELAPGGQWASDTANPINGYAITEAAVTPVTTILIPAGQTSASITLTGLGDANDAEGNELVTIAIVNVTGADENGVQSEDVTILDGPAALMAPSSGGSSSSPLLAQSSSSSPSSTALAPGSGNAFALYTVQSDPLVLSSPTANSTPIAVSDTASADSTGSIGSAASSSTSSDSTTDTANQTQADVNEEIDNFFMGWVLFPSLSLV